eukprot:1161263-Pelagomonas_calceolata.AAC.34
MRQPAHADCSKRKDTGMPLCTFQEAVQTQTSAIESMHPNKTWRIALWLQQMLTLMCHGALLKSSKSRANTSKHSHRWRVHRIVFGTFTQQMLIPKYHRAPLKRQGRMQESTQRAAAAAAAAAIAVVEAVVAAAAGVPVAVPG